MSIRFIILLVLAATSPLNCWYLKSLAIAVAFLLILDIVIVHTAIAFVTQKPENLLRSAILSTFSFVQLPVAFAIFYRSLNNSFCSPLSTIQALYFSVVTITTLGYGDIKPKADASVAQGLVIAEVVIGVYFIKNAC